MHTVTLLSDHFLTGRCTWMYIAIQWMQKLAKMIEVCKISHENTKSKEIHRLKTIGKILHNIL
jgi:hypothetical protein